jgi:hypothetical protein
MMADVAGYAVSTGITRLGVAGYGWVAVAVGTQLDTPIGLPRDPANLPECSHPAEAAW